MDWWVVGLTAVLAAATGLLLRLCAALVERR